MESFWVLVQCSLQQHCSWYFFHVKFLDFEAHFSCCGAGSLPIPTPSTVYRWCFILARRGGSRWSALVLCWSWFWLEFYTSAAGHRRNTLRVSLRNSHCAWSSVPVALVVEKSRERLQILNHEVDGHMNHLPPDRKKPYFLKRFVSSGTHTQVGWWLMLVTVTKRCRRIHWTYCYYIYFS